MTDEEINTPASRDLDRLVAEKVMKQVRSGDCPIGDFNCPGIWTSRDECWWAPCLPCYSKDIAAAWEVVKRLRATGCAVHIGTHNNGHEWTVRASRGCLRASWEGHGDTAPLAICRAALRAVAAV